MRKSVEELLVPEEERPYEVPENWVWTKLGNINQRRGSTLDPSKKPEELFELYSVPSWDSFEPEVIHGENIKSSKQCVDPGDVLICKINPRINRVWVVQKDKGLRQIASSEWIVLNTANKFNSQYLRRYCESPHFRSLMTSEVSGVGGSLTRARPKNVNEYGIPLPPLKEQQRIVNAIESLFAKLDKAKELISEVREEFEHRKAAILAKAFRGELTEKWREENQQVESAKEMLTRIHSQRKIINSNSWPKRKPNYLNYELNNSVLYVEKIPQTWVVALVGLLCDCIVPNRDKPKSFTGQIPWVTLPEITGDYIDGANCPLKLTIEEVNEYKARLIPKDSVIMSCVGRFGISAVAAMDIVINQQLHAFLPSEVIIPKYLMYHIRVLGDYLNNVSTATTISYVNKEKCNSLPINLPPLEEQKEIVHILDKLFEDEAKIEELTQLEDQIETMKKAILAKAFRGELGTNDPSEESAMELLKKVFQEKAG